MADTDSTALSDEAALAEQKRKEAYFTAGQMKLIWARFKKNRSAMVGGVVLLTLISMGVFAPFLSPYDPTIAGRDRRTRTGPRKFPIFGIRMAFRCGRLSIAMIGSGPRRLISVG